MTIGINATLYQPFPGGVEKAILGATQGLLATAASQQLSFFVSTGLAGQLDLIKLPPGVSVDVYPYRSRFRRILLERGLVSRGADILLWHHLGYVAPWMTNRPAIVSVYDLIALTHPELCARLNRLYYRLALPTTIHQARLVIVPSDYIAREIRRLFPNCASRTRVLPLPIPTSIALAREKYVKAGTGNDKYKEIAGRCILMLGDSGPKKNLDFALRCYARLPSALRKGHPLWICGKPRGRQGFRKYVHLAKALDISDSVEFRSYVPEAELAALYANAALLVYPSLIEGYGYPPLEAMALGTPAIVSDRGALPEVAGRSGAVVAPLIEEAFTDHIAKLLTDGSLYEERRRAGLDGVIRATWIDYARQLLSIYDEILS